MRASRPLLRYRWVILGLSFVAQLSNALSALAVAPLAPIFQPELGLSKTEVGFFASAAFAGATSVLLMSGTVTDRWGVRKMMSLGQVATGVLVLSMSMVTSFLHAVVVMFAAGLGRGAAAPGVTKSLVDWFPPTARGTAVGISQAAVPAAGILTASTLPALALAVGWRGAIGLVGVAILAGGVATAILYRRAPWEEAPTRKGGGRSSFGAVMANRRMWLLGGVGPLFGAVQFSLNSYLALFFSEVVLVSMVPEMGPRVVAAGVFLALSHTGGIFSRVFWGMVSDRAFRGRRMAVLAVVGGLSALMSLVLAFLGPGHPAWLLAAIAFASGASVLGWQGLYMAVAAETAGPKNAGTGAGFCMTWTGFGLVAGPPLFGLVLDLTGSYQSAWLMLAGFAAVATLCTAIMVGGEHSAEGSPI